MSIHQHFRDTIEEQAAEIIELQEKLAIYKTDMDCIFQILKSESITKEAKIMDVLDIAMNHRDAPVI